jgi:hypothetical protein
MEELFSSYIYGLCSIFFIPVITKTSSVPESNRSLFLIRKLMAGQPLNQLFPKRPVLFPIYPNEKHSLLNLTDPVCKAGSVFCILNFGSGILNLLSPNILLLNNQLDCNKIIRSKKIQNSRSKIQNLFTPQTHSLQSSSIPSGI